MYCYPALTFFLLLPPAFLGGQNSSKEKLLFPNACQRNLGQVTDFPQQIQVYIQEHKVS